MTIESNQLVRTIVIVVLGVATGAMIAVSMRANYLFGYGFGQTAEKAQVFGWANVARHLESSRSYRHHRALACKAKAICTQPCTDLALVSAVGPRRSYRRLFARSHIAYRRARSEGGNVQRYRT
jgi:hypothetical protein